MIKSLFKAEIALWQRSRRRLLPARPCDWSCCHRLGLMALLFILHSSISSICSWSCCHRLRLIALLSIPYPSISSMLSHIGIDSILSILHPSISSICIWLCCHRYVVSRNCERSHLLLCFFLDLCHFSFSSILLYALVATHQFLLGNPYFFILVCVFQASLNITLLMLAFTTDTASTCQTFSGDNKSIISTEDT